METAGCCKNHIFNPSSWSGMFGAEFLESHRKAIETLVKQYGMAKKRPQTNSVLTNKEFPLAISISNSPQEHTINTNTRNIQQIKGKQGIRYTVYPPLRGARKSAQLEHHHQNLLNKTGKSRSFCISPWICNPGDMQNQQYPIVGFHKWRHPTNHFRKPASFRHSQPIPPFRLD